MATDKSAEKRAAKRGRRSPAPGGRPLSVVVWLSEREMALIGGMAARECLAVSAWLGEAGVRAATQPVDAAAPGPGLGMREVLAVHVGLVDLRRILRNVGGNLNDVARHANVTGTLAAETSEVGGGRAGGGAGGRRPGRPACRDGARPKLSGRSSRRRGTHRDMNG